MYPLKFIGKTGVSHEHFRPQPIRRRFRSRADARQPPLMTLRNRLMLLAAVCVLPAGLLLAAFQVQLRRERESEVRQQIVRLAQGDFISCAATCANRDRSLFSCSSSSFFACSCRFSLRTSKYATTCRASAFSAPRASAGAV